jgi:hypothetical protein
MKVLVVAPIVGIKVPAAALKIPAAPEILVQTPPACSPVINENKLMEAVFVSQTDILPSAPAVGCGLILMVASEVSFTQGGAPVSVYVKVEEEAPKAGKKVPAVALKVPPEPEVLVQTPPVCSPVIKENKLREATDESQTVTLPSTPALGCGLIVIVAREVSFAHGATPLTVYVKVEEEAPKESTKVPVEALKVPPAPDVRVQIPPACSPEIKENKSTMTIEDSQIIVLPSEPALG